MRQHIHALGTTTGTPNPFHYEPPPTAQGPLAKPGTQHSTTKQPVAKFQHCKHQNVPPSQANEQQPAAELHLVKFQNVPLWQEHLPPQTPTMNNWLVFSTPCSHQQSAFTLQSDQDKNDTSSNTSNSTSTPSSSTQSESSTCHTTSSTDSNSTDSHSNISTFSMATDRLLCPCIPINYNEALLKRVYDCPQVRILNNIWCLLNSENTDKDSENSDFDTNCNSESDMNS